MRIRNTYYTCTYLWKPCLRFSIIKSALIEAAEIKEKKEFEILRAKAHKAEKELEEKMKEELEEKMEYWVRYYSNI